MSVKPASRADSALGMTTLLALFPDVGSSSRVTRCYFLEKLRHCADESQ